MSIFCSALSGSLPLRFQWLKDGQSISKSNDNIETNLIDEMNSLLVIKNVSSFHNGNYTCSVQNDIGIDAHTVRVTVKGIENW